MKEKISLKNLCNSQWKLTVFQLVRKFPAAKPLRFYIILSIFVKVHTTVSNICFVFIDLGLIWRYIGNYTGVLFCWPEFTTIIPEIQ
jgi:hypothetical protein